MDYAPLGSTGIEASVLSLGAGGFSRLGLRRGKSEAHARRVVEAALDHGINLIDTAEDYGTESVVGEAIAGVPREDVVISTKYGPYDDDRELRPPEEITESVAESLERLGTDYIDIYHLHVVSPEDYDFVVEELRPRLERLKAEGTIRFAGITETISRDPEHEMLERAVVEDPDLWDVVMVGFNLLNQTARERVLEPAAGNGIGTIAMVAVRNAMSDPEVLEATVTELIEDGVLDPDEVEPRDPFGFLVHEGGADDLVDAAYRFCRYEPGVDTVLTGTASRDHLAANVESVHKGPLPDADLARLAERFGHVDSVIGN